MGPSHTAWVNAAIVSYEAKLLRYASDIVGPSLARDVVQDTFLKLCRADRDQVESHLSAWLFTVCRNGAIEVKRKVRRLTELDPQSADHTPLSPERMEQEQALARVLSIIAALPDKQREVVRLKFDAELSYKEIAEVTGLSVSNVGFILHTALANVRADLERGEQRPAAAQGRTR